MSNKYEFVPGDEIPMGNGRTLKRIRALIAITAFDVLPGQLGGYIEHENNLSHYGDAWVYGNARVSGDAWVSGDARVKRRGQVCWFSEVGSEYGTLTMYLQKNGTIEVTRGCFKGGIDEFLKASAEKHDARIRKEYELLIEVGRSRICAEE